MGYKEDINSAFHPFVTKAPCKNCEDRHVGCHAECEKYKQFKKDAEEAKRAAIKKMKRETDYMEGRYGAQRPRRYRKWGQK